MSDEFPICPNCSNIDSLRNVAGKYPQAWTKEQIEEFENNWYWCVECKKIVAIEGLKYVHSED